MKAEDINYLIEINTKEELKEFAKATDMMTKQSETYLENKCKWCEKTFMSERTLSPHVY